MSKTLALAATALQLCLSTPAVAQGTVFSYQGRLTDGQNPADGIYDLRFAVYDLPAAGTQLGQALTNASTPVSNGLFTVTLDFGNVFTGDQRWLEISVRTNGALLFTPLTPRQFLSATPYAITAGNVTGVVPGGGLTGTYSGAVTFNNPDNNFTGNGTGLTNVNAATLGGLVLGSFWQTGGNSGITPGTNFLGTTDYSPLEIKVNGVRALRLEPNTNGAPNVVGGSPANFVSGGVDGATIGGGGTTNFFGFWETNSVTASFGTVSGGYGNNAAGFAAIVGGGVNNTANDSEATVGGGAGNFASGSDATVGGGYVNTASGTAATVGGGANNTASTIDATVAGGNFNTASNSKATVGGGEQNTAGGPWATVSGGDMNSATGDHSTVAGGRNNTAAGQYSFAAGFHARATHSGAFVWADGSAGDFPSLRTNQFRVRADGGARFDVNSNSWVEVYAKTVVVPPFTFVPKFIDTSTGAYLSPGGVWTDSSDRNTKEDFQPVDGRKILEQVSTLPITRWNYRVEGSAVQHIGPVAQDFQGVFRLSADDRHIAPLDTGGVALAAIQGLNHKLIEESKRRDAENADLKRKNQTLEKRLEALENRVLPQEQN